jgi:transglutaminase-like putative cysteine protease
LQITSDAVVRDSGAPDVISHGAIQHPVPQLSDEALVLLLGSRYCETDRLSEIAWKMLSTPPPGGARAQAICDFVHQHITFEYEHARPKKTAWETYNEGNGVRRDFTHLPIALCRCMNIPARYCTGYLGDIGRPKDPSPMDCAGWFEAYLAGAWHTFDPRNHVPRIGRVLIALGGDAADVAIVTIFGPNALRAFRV